MYSASADASSDPRWLGRSSQLFSARTIWATNQVVSASRGVSQRSECSKREYHSHSEVSMDSVIKKLTMLGQSLWYDNIQRKLLENGEMAAMIARGDVRGVTSNPTLFNNAISKSNDYDSALVPLAWAGWDAEKIFCELDVEDIKTACSLFHPVFDDSNGGDGYVSIEVSPFLSADTHATAAQAQQLWARVAKSNLMVKIPATPAGIPAIRSSISAGININITLIFSLTRYAEVMEAYLSALEDRLAAGRPIAH